MKLVRQTETWHLTEQPTGTRILNTKRPTIVGVHVEHGKEIGEAAQVDVSVKRGDCEVLFPLADLPELIVILQEIEIRNLPFTDHENENESKETE